LKVGREFVGLESQDPVWTADAGPDRLSLFLGRMRHNWRLAICVFSVSVLTALLLAYFLPSYWRVEETLIPVARSSGGGLSLGSLAGLAGGLSGGGLGGLGSILGRAPSSQDESLAVLNSRELFDTYATRENLLPILFASRWDSQNRRWLVSGNRVPTLRSGYRLFDRNIRDVELDRRSGIVTFSITWKDRTQALKWARDLVDLTNAQMRARALTEAGNDMRYLSAAMRQANNDNASNQLTAALSSGYERALQDYMFAKGQPQYAFRIVDPPTYPDDRERVWPQRLVFVALGVMAGALLATLAVLMKTGWQARRRSDAVGPVPAYAPDL
jgi:hypothetical protein